ncbi:MAG: DUF1007 family protein [Pseudomonadota bacterium]
MAAGTATAHPHVFIDGGIDFIVSQSNVLEAVKVTWRFDEFETLYAMSANSIAKGANEQLSGIEVARLALFMTAASNEPVQSAHLTLGNEALPLSAADDFSATLVDNRLEVTFVRPLMEPISIDGRVVEASFHEATYFYAFSLTDPSELIGDQGDCSASTVQFEADKETEELKEVLSSLGREETPDIENVGALFADRITVTCG